MTETLLESGVVKGLRNRTLSEIASGLEEEVKPAILVMPTDGLVGQEEDFSFADEPEPENSAPVQDLEAQEEAEAEQLGEVPQAKLIKRFRSALKAADEADASVLAAERSSCAKQHRLGKVAIDLKASFSHGEWGKFLAAEKVDQNRINRAMRIAKYLTEGQCEKLPILAAERLVKKTRDYAGRHEGNPPNRTELATLVEEAMAEYQSERRKQAKKAGEIATVELVDPQVGRYYRLNDDEVHKIVGITEDELRTISAGGGYGNYPDGIRSRSKLAHFCADVAREATEEEYEERMAAWRQAVEEDVADSITIGGFYSVNGVLVRVDDVNVRKVRGLNADSTQFECDLFDFARLALERDKEKWDEAVAAVAAESVPSGQATTAPVTKRKVGTEAKPEPEVQEGSDANLEVADRPADAPPPDSVLEQMLADFEKFADLIRGVWDDQTWGDFAEAVDDASDEAYQNLLDAVGGDHRFAAMIAIAAYREANPEDEVEASV